MAAHRLTAWHGRLLTISTVVALTCLAGCGSPEAGDNPTAKATPTATQSSSNEPSAKSDVDAGPIDGTWSGPTLDRAAFRRALDRQRLGQHADAFVAEVGRKVDLTLEIGSGFWTLTSSVDGQPATAADRGSYEVVGSRVTVSPNSGGENVFRWKVAGDELSLIFLSTTEPPYEGVPAEVFQRGLYTTSAFTKDAQ